MPAARLSGTELADHLRRCPAELCDLLLELRARVLQLAPQVDEAIKFNALSYFKPNTPWGSIGGNVCMIGCKDGRLYLGFIHGAHLPDPERLLEGTAKSKRVMEIRAPQDIRRSAVRDLIRAAAAFTPAE